MLSFKKLRIKWRVKVNSDLNLTDLIQNPAAGLPGFFMPDYAQKLAKNT